MLRLYEMVVISRSADQQADQHAGIRDQLSSTEAQLRCQSTADVLMCGGMAAPAAAAAAAGSRISLTGGRLTADGRSIEHR
eukprot:COSAG01_NODE_1430_length_10325_cov_7.452376_7_plen_81_part_00